LFAFAEKQATELQQIKQACDRCREILDFVNQAVKEAEDKQVCDLINVWQSQNELLPAQTDYDMPSSIHTAASRCMPRLVVYDAYK